MSDYSYHLCRRGSIPDKSCSFLIVSLSKDLSLCFSVFWSACKTPLTSSLLLHYRVEQYIHTRMYIVVDCLATQTGHVLLELYYLLLQFHILFIIHYWNYLIFFYWFILHGLLELLTFITGTLIYARYTILCSNTYRLRETLFCISYFFLRR